MTTLDPSSFAHSPEAKKPSFWLRLFFAIPIFGWMARDISKDASNIYWALATLVAGWGCAILLFGYAGLIIPALALVALIFVLLIVITRG